MKRQKDENFLSKALFERSISGHQNILVHIVRHSWPNKKTATKKHVPICVCPVDINYTTQSIAIQ